MKKDARHIIKYDRISSEDMRKMYKIMIKNEISSEYTLPKKPSSDGFYHLWIRDDTKKGGRKQIKAKSIDELIEKIYEHRSEPSRRSFRTIFNTVQAERLKYIKDPERLLSVQNTIKRNYDLYNRYFDDTEFELKEIGNITKEDIEDFCYTTLQRYDMSKKAFLNLRSVLNSVLKYSYEEYWILDNPYTRINFAKYNDMLIRPASNDERVHTEEEIKMILDEIHRKQISKPKYIPPYALELQMAMGLRRGEIPPLQWSDIKDAYIEISKELIKTEKEKGIVIHTIVNHTKTYKNRRFPITSKVDTILKRLYEVHMKYYLDSPFLFPGKAQDGCITNYVVNGYYKNICRTLDIKLSVKAIKGPHSFRRNAITNTLNSGANIFMTSQLYGNTPKVAEQNYYTGVDLSNAKQILEKGNQK